VLINTVTGLQGADGQQLELMRSVNASRWQEYRQIRFPTAIPFFFAGLKLALSVSVIGAIVAEWVSATEGLGYLLVYYNATLDTAKLFAVLVVLVILASALFAVLGLAERLLSWESRLKQATGRGVVVDTRRQAEAAL
jgi:NitT/TauT family transport system permease protein